MIARIFEELGPWTWWVLGLALLAAEILLPGLFLVWIGVAAILTGALSLMFWDIALWHMPGQFLAFAVLTLLSASAGRRALARLDPPESP